MCGVGITQASNNVICSSHSCRPMSPTTVQRRRRGIHAVPVGLGEGLAAALLLCLPPAATVGTAGCGLLPPVTPGTTQLLDYLYEGMPRQAAMHVPQGYCSSTPYPLVLGFHGYCGDWQTITLRWDALADSESFVLISVRGEEEEICRSFNGGGTTGSPGPEGSTCVPGSGGDDYWCGHGLSRVPWHFSTPLVCLLPTGHAYPRALKQAVAIAVAAIRAATLDQKAAPQTVVTGRPVPTTLGSLPTCSTTRWATAIADAVT